MHLLNGSRKEKIMATVLWVWAFVLIVFHTLLAAFRYVIDYTVFTDWERWAAVGLLGAAVIFFVLSVFTSKERRGRIWGSFRRLRSFELFALIGLFVWYAISCSVNQHYGDWRYLKIEDWHLFDSALLVFLFFTVMQSESRKTAVLKFEVLVHIVVILYSVFTVVSLWRIYPTNVIEYPSGEFGGVTKDVQLLLGYHYNITGMIAATMFCLCFYMMLTQETIIRILYGVFAFVHLVVIYLCNSRTVFVGVMAFVFVAGFFLPWQLMRRKKLALRWGGSILICAFCVLLYWYAREWAFIIFENVTHFSEELAKEMEASGRFEAVLLGRSGIPAFRADFLSAAGADSARGLTNLNYRDDVWKAALKVMISSPRVFFFGVTPFGVPDAVWEIGAYHRERIAHAHNIILQIGVSMGVPAMLMFVSFLISVAVRCIRTLIGKTGESMKYAFVLPASILCFVVINIAESYLFAYFSVISCFFFLLCGWVVALDKNKL